MTEVYLCTAFLCCLGWVVSLKMDVQTLKEENTKLRAAIKVGFREMAGKFEVSSPLPTWAKKP